jgi:type IV secretory pathway VirJ component
MRRVRSILLVATGVVLAGALVLWSPWSRVSLERATVVLPATLGAVAPAGKRDVLAIIYSGDGGWADLDKQLGDAFRARGIPVLGVNTFRYYWRNRSPETSAAQLDALMTKYADRWDKRRVWLVGFSFGADVLPSIVSRLSPANRARVTQLVLLSASRSVNFEIELEGYMSSQGWWKEHLKTFLQRINPVRHYDARPPLLALHGQPPVACYYGLGERDDSLCAEPGLPAWITVHAKPGGHHFDGGYQPLAAQMLDELPAAADPAP